MAFSLRFDMSDCNSQNDILNLPHKITSNLKARGGIALAAGIGLSAVAVISVGSGLPLAALAAVVGAVACFVLARDYFVCANNIKKNLLSGEGLRFPYGNQSYSPIGLVWLGFTRGASVVEKAIENSVYKNTLILGSKFGQEHLMPHVALKL